MSNEYYKNQEESIAFIYGRISVQIEDFAKLLNLSERELATRLGTLLLGLQSRQKIRAENNVSKLRTKTTKRTKGLRKMEVASGTHRNKTHKKNSAIKKWWSQFTPEQRKNIIHARMKKGLGKKS